MKPGRGRGVSKTRNESLSHNEISLFFNVYLLSTMFNNNLGLLLYDIIIVKQYN